MKFKYLGDEYTEWFGFKWITGMIHDVTDAHAIKKISNSVLFEAVEAPIEAAPSEPEKRKPGRPKKEVIHDDSHNQ